MGFRDCRRNDLILQTKQNIPVRASAADAGGDFLYAPDAGGNYGSAPTVDQARLMRGGLIRLPGSSGEPLSAAKLRGQNSNPAPVVVVLACRSRLPGLTCRFGRRFASRGCHRRPAPRTKKQHRSHSPVLPRTKPIGSGKHSTRPQFSILHSPFSIFHSFARRGHFDGHTVPRALTADHQPLTAVKTAHPR